MLTVFSECWDWNVHGFLPASVNGLRPYSWRHQSILSSLWCLNKLQLRGSVCCPVFTLIHRKDAWQTCPTSTRPALLVNVSTNSLPSEKRDMDVMDPTEWPLGNFYMLKD